MTEEQLKLKIENYLKALGRLDEALKHRNPDQFVYDATIQRFEFTYELAWKLMKAFLEYQGQESINFPRDVFKRAFAAGLIQDGDVWLTMMKDRNITTHTYDEAGAKEIYTRIKKDYRSQLYALAETIQGAF